MCNMGKIFQRVILFIVTFYVKHLYVFFELASLHNQDTYLELKDKKSSCAI